jgi:hypothetical protein
MSGYLSSGIAGLAAALMVDSVEHHKKEKVLLLQIQQLQQRNFHMQQYIQNQGLTASHAESIPQRLATLPEDRFELQH